MRGHRRLPLIVATALGAAVVLGTCVTDEVQRRPTDPRADRLTPSPTESPPFAPSAAANAEPQPPLNPSSQPVVVGEIVRRGAQSVTVRDETGGTYELHIGPQTVVGTALEEGERVRAAWTVDEEQGLSATAIIPANDSRAAPQLSPDVGPNR